MKKPFLPLVLCLICCIASTISCTKEVFEDIGPARDTSSTKFLPAHADLQSVCCAAKISYNYYEQKI